MKNTIKNKRGMTLVELVTALAVAAIISAISVFSIFMYMQFAEFKKQNEIAETLYSAAQAQFTQFSQKGTLEDYFNLSDTNAVKLQSIVLPDGSSASSSGIWGNSGSSYQGTICSLMIPRGAFKDYVPSNDGSDIDLLYRLFDSYIYDKSVLADASICIEFDPKEGLVYSVLYSDKADAFSYNGTGGVNICDRTEDYRKDKMIGYYGVETLSKSTSVKVEKPVISSVKLNNTDVLELVFSLSKVKDALGKLNYTISVCDSTTDETELEIFINNEALRTSPFDKANYTFVAKDASYTTLTIAAQVENKKDSSYNGTYIFPAYIDSDESIHIIFDAVDFSAKAQSDKTELFDTFSIYRLGLTSNNVFCFVYGSGDNYKRTAEKRSNSENIAFGRASKSVGSDTEKYSIMNARHLYNIRFAEEKAKTDGKKHIYSIAADIDWKAQINAGFVYRLKSDVKKSLTGWNDAGNTSKDQFVQKDLVVVPADNLYERAFPSFVKLLPSSQFGSDTSARVYSIRNLVITNSKNDRLGVSSVFDNPDLPDGANNGTTGLFLENTGVIRNLTLDNITVVGVNNVGSFCGMNDGTLEWLNVVNESGESSVTGGYSDGMNQRYVGGYYVGGIAGVQQEYTSLTENKTVRYSHIVNRAAVSGFNRVGGIIGEVKGYKDAESGFLCSAVIEHCNNYGKVVVPDNVYNIDPEYFGGLTGKITNLYTESPDSYFNVTISDSSSSPQYSDFEIDAIVTSLDTRTLNGVFVGGLVGKNDWGAISNCDTVSEAGQSGYIIGKKYVGGIVGLNSGPAGSVDGGENSRNQVNVIGNEYVGGIVGANAKLGTNDEPDKDRQNSADVKISNWLNEGVVISTGNYIGGITGFNAGIIQNCVSDVDYDETAQNLISIIALNSNYAGGIAGYNNGVIRKSETYSDTNIQVNAVIRGNNYVGGIIGYNDRDSEVYNYQLLGGYINGENFVGGFIGLNTNPDLFKPQGSEEYARFIANPNIVSGNYFVSGIIGANIVLSEDNIITAYDSDNEMGTVSGKAFVGGFIGYNNILKNSIDDSRDTDEKIINSVIGYINENVVKQPVLEDAINALDRLGSESLLLNKERAVYVSDIISNAMFTINGNAVRLSGIEAQVYVGGVIGYNDLTSLLHIENVINYTPVRAYDSVNDENLANASDDFSFAGGIVGRITTHSIIENCSNSGKGEVNALGTYLGGIAELNNGIVYNCTGGNIGSNVKSNVGGIIGYNDASGSFLVTNENYAQNFVGAPFYNSNKYMSHGIYECTLKGTVTGTDNIGGIVSSNCGVVYGPKFDKSGVIGYGENIGGVAAKNYGNGTITLTDTVNINITGTGTNVGGIAGVNSAYIGLGANSDAAITAVSADSSITGNSNVAGIIGRCDALNYTLTDFTNSADITAFRGNSAGLVSSAVGSINIHQCNNFGSVQSTESGNAGGLVADNKSGNNIESSNNYASVEASNGLAGGIASVNGGDISDCRVIASGTDVVEIRGSAKSGGIAAENSVGGAITNSGIIGITVSNILGSPAGDIGAFAGTNRGSISLGALPMSGNITVGTYSNKSNVGGVAGVNYGSVTSLSAYSQIGGIEDNQPKLTIKFLSGAANVSNMGGIAGVNNSEISDCRVFAFIDGNKGNETFGYGGIAAINSADISNCSFDGTVSADGSASEIVNVGGITGINHKDANVTGCIVGRLKDSYVLNGMSAGAFGNLGGVVGRNIGNVSSCDNESYSLASAVFVTGYAGHVGGVVGFNDVTGVVAGTQAVPTSTGSNWTVNAKYYSNDCGTGGIMGYSSSGCSYEYLENHADVYNTSGKTENTAVGGVIGRYENTVSLDAVLYKCENYGDIWSTSLTGGMIGRIKYNCCTFDSCLNYGNVGIKPAAALIGSVSGNAGYSSGILASTYYTSANQCLTFKNCENHGKIYATGAAGGIAARLDTKQSGATVSIDNCLNTGVIMCDTQAAGIATYGTVTTRIYNTRNYGISTSKNFYGITNIDKAALEGCLDFSNTPNGLSKGKVAVLKDDYNYYVDQTGTGVVETPFVQVSGTNLSSQKTNLTATAPAANPMSVTYDANMTTRCSVNLSDKSVIKIGSQNAVIITYNLKSPTELDGIGVRWCNNGTSTADVRQYAYVLEYSTDSGLSWNKVTSQDTSSGVERTSYNPDIAYYLNGVADSGLYVENGYNTADNPMTDAAYYHELAQSELVTNFRFSVVEVRNIPRKAGKNAASGVLSTASGWTNREYVCIWDVYAVKPGSSFSATNSFCVATTASSVSGELANPLLTKNESGKYNLYDANLGFIRISDIGYNPLGVGSGVDNNGNSNSVKATADYSKYYDYKTLPDESIDSFRYKLIKNIEPGIIEGIKAMYSKDAVYPAPTDFKAVNFTGGLKLSWNYTLKAAGYLVEVFADDDGNGISDSGAALESYTVREKSIVLSKEDDWIGKNVVFSVKAIYWKPINGVFTEMYSPAATTGMQISSVLPTPMVHMSFLGGDASEEFELVLENPEDFSSVGDYYIDIIIGGKATPGARLTTGQKKSQPFGNTLKDGAILQAQAFPGGSGSPYTASQIRAVHTNIYGVNELHNNTYSSCRYNGFYGDTLTGMYNSISISAVGTVEDKYYNNELVVYDEDLGINVAVSHGESHVTSLGGTMTTTLSNLPDDIFSHDAVTVRSYPWKTKGSMVYYGETVEESVTRRELIDKDEIVSGIFNEDGTLADGYVVQMNEDGTYRILYSTILKNADYYPKQILEFTYDITDTAINGIPRRKIPVIDPGFEEISLNGNTSYKFTWDKGLGQNASGTTYNISLNGITTDGTEVELYTTNVGKTAQNYSSAEDVWNVVIPDNNWNYPNIRLRVEHVGAVNSSGAASVFASVSQRLFNLKIALPRIAIPTISLHTLENGSINKDTLIYDIDWTSLRNEFLPYLDHYEVTVRGLESGLVKVYSTADEAISASPDAVMLVADLNAFKRGEMLQISVRAIANDNDIYRSGSEGVIRETNLAARMLVPEMRPSDPDYGITSDLSYENTLGESELTDNGIVVTMKAPQSAVKGKYEMNVEIFDSIGGTSLESLTPSAPLAMVGDLISSYCRITGISPKYAGKYLRISMRATSDNFVSSVWTDSEDSGVTPYAWIRLPKVRINNVELSETTKYCDYIVYQDGISTGLNYIGSIEHTAIEFDIVDLASDYDITLVRSRFDTGIRENDRALYTSPVDNLYLAHNEDGSYTVSFSSTSLPDSDGELVEIGSISDGDELELPYTVKASDDSEGFYVMLSAKIALDGDTFTLTLPDSENVYKAAIHATTNVSVIAVPSDTENYASSYCPVWYRGKTEEVETTGVLVFNDRIEAPGKAAIAATLKAVNTPGYLAQLRFTNPLTRRMAALISGGGITRYVSIPGAELDNGTISSVLTMSEAVYSDMLAESKIEMRIQYIDGITGVSYFSEPVTLVLEPLE